jgi:hypothetical protein
MINKSIGGYFELELNNLKSVFHENAIGLNTGRNALEYILKARAIKYIYIPYFTCDVLLEPIRKLKIPYEFYSINEHLEPLFDFSVLGVKDCFLITNYFGLKDNYIKQLSLNYMQLVVDNAHAFYSKPYNNVPTFYSARKFFGVPDGAFLYCDIKLKQVFEKDNSYKRMSHLLIRKDLSAELGYLDFIKNDKLLENQPIKLMSTLTKDILKTIDYQSGAKKRIENYRFLEDVLKSSNQLTLQLDQESVPMVYPYWPKDITLRKRLHDNKIYTACYWPNVKKSCGENSLEFRLACEVIYLPIDQRYRIKDMIKILNIIKA